MAGGNSPRQRMINLMYLVFIAMLALNMGKEVLSAFGVMNEKLETANSRMQETNLNALEELRTRKDEKPEEFTNDFKDAELLQQASQNYYNYLETLKKDIMSQAKDKKDYQTMDNSDYLDEKFFQGDALKKEGKKFVNNYVNYRKTLFSIIAKNKKVSELKGTVEGRFKYGKNGNGTETDREGVKHNWLNFHYEGYPYIAAVTKISQIQADIRQTEQDFYVAMLGASLKNEISMKHYTTLLEQNRGAFYQNQSFDGAIVLGRKDKSTRPSKVELFLDKRPLKASEYEIEDGRIKLNINTGGIGEHKITGSLHYEQDGEVISVPVEQTFTTIPRPNEAVISADKMNVVYRGVENPITISMPGVSDNNVTASAPGLTRRSGSNYVMNPGAGSEVTIVVTGKIDGQQFSSSKKFRIKGLPKPQGAILQTTGAVRLPKANIIAGEVSVKYEDFDFELSTRVTSFRVLVPGKPSVVVNGNRISRNPAAQSAVNGANKGDIIQISEIRYAVSGYSGTPTPATPISIEVQ